MQREYDELKAEVESLETDGGGLDDEVEEASQALSESEEKLTELRAAEREAQKEHAGFAARKEALELGLNRKDGAGALLAATDRLSGLLGSVAAILTVESGAEAAVAAALGTAADAVAVTSVDSAVNAIRLLKADDAGQATVIVGGDVSYPDDGEWPELPGNARYVIDLIQVQEELRPAFTRLLNRMAVVEDLSEASELIGRLPAVRAVTRDGDVLGRDSARGGSSSAPTLLEVQAAVDEAAEKLYEAGARAERLRTELEFATAERQSAKAQVDSLMAQRREADSQKAGVAQQLGRLGGQARAALGEVERFVAAIAKAEEARERDLAQIEELEGQLLEAQEAAAAAEELDDALSTSRRDTFSQQATAARTAEMEARLAVRTAEERARALAGRADQLDRAAQQEREARERAIERAERLAEEAEVARAVAHGFEQVIRHLEQSLALAQARREQAERARVEHDAGIQVVRARVRELSGELEKLTDSVHRDEVARAERRMRIEQMEEKALAEHGVEADVLVAEYGPEVPIPPTVEGDIPVPYDRAEQQRRLKKAEKDYAALGKVNPLALEEFAALEERHQFLSEQLEDLKKTRKDLLDIIKEVDDRVEQVFTEAYADVAARVRGRVLPAVPRRRRPADPHRPRGHADHRHRGRGAPAGQEGQAPVAAVRRRALADRRGVPGLDLQGPALAVLHHGRGRGGPGRHQPGPPDQHHGGAAGHLAADRDHAPEAHHGGRRRAVRRHHARGRRHHGHQPEAARQGDRDDERRAQGRPGADRAGRREDRRREGDGRRDRSEPYPAAMTTEGIRLSRRRLPAAGAARPTRRPWPAPTRATSRTWSRGSRSARTTSTPRPGSC